MANERTPSDSDELGRPVDEDITGIGEEDFEEEDDLDEEDEELDADEEMEDR